jgi:uncharacterized protein (TIGR02147 family)
MVQGYSDYRQILKDSYIEKSSRNPRFSLRAFAHYLEMSPSWLHEVLNGKKGISKTTAARLAKRLGLSDEEKKFFVCLSASQDSRKPSDRERAQKKLEKIRLRMHNLVIDPDVFQVIAQWHHFAILELTLTDNGKTGLDDIAKRLGISKVAVAEAFDRLEKLGLVVRKGDRLKKARDRFLTKTDVPQNALKIHHEQILHKAIQALHSQPIDKRDFGAMTMAINPEKIKEAKKRIRKFRNEMADFMCKDNLKNVYVFSTQLFSLEELV